MRILDHTTLAPNNIHYETKQSYLIRFFPTVFHMRHL